MQGPILSIKPGTITDHLTVSFCQLNEVFNYYTYAFDTGIVACASVCVCVCVHHMWSRGEGGGEVYSDNVIWIPDPYGCAKKGVWGKILSGSVLSTEIFLSVLMRERTSLQATSV